MRYFGFLLKNNLIINILSCLSPLFLMIYLKSEIHDVPLDKLFLTQNLIYLWMFVSYTYWVDLSNNMIAKVLVSSRNRIFIWVAKLFAPMLNTISLVMVETILILFVRGFGRTSCEMIINTLSLTFLMLFWLVGIISLGSVLFRNTKIIIFSSFVYVTPYIYYLLEHVFGNSNYKLINKNPFFEMLRMYNEVDIKAGSVCLVLVTSSLFWLFSFVIHNKKEYRDNI